MVQTIQATNLTLRDLKTKYSLQEIARDQFFREWVDNLPELTDLEKQLLDRVKANYLHLAERPMLENTIKMVVLSPLLDLGGFYQAPFDIDEVNAAPAVVRQENVDSEYEVSVPISAEDEGAIFKGKIDVLALKGQLWILVIESKRARFAVMEAIPQALAYMMASPNVDIPTFGLAINGSEFIFLKLTKQETPQYGLSRLFSILNPGNDLYNVLSILKRIGALISS
jgi:hypothetical protein